ncbi:MAG: nucleotidyltransferase family protein [Undibacterium sp.]|uniref:nucleotidyltransferase family protein n=1 Tax=Undibacterium sp. TaxID=1914977 RepID=UPI00271ECCA3|nr:nucleotidyltransferase family protein [Undibacterium sp.]MDO8654107.1 nucleotidyltransferase family protein [Undibacterium sp.]
MNITRAWCGIVLAAGKGQRFDASGERNKLLQLLPSGLTVAGSSAKNLLAVLPHSLAVLPPSAWTNSNTHASTASLAALLASAGCEIAIRPVIGSEDSADRQDGMANSLVHGLRQSPADCAGWVIALADMPYVQPESIAAILTALQNGADIAVPVCQGRRGNPVGFSRRYLPQLLALTGDQGARALLNMYPVTEVLVNDPGIFQDIDIPEDLSSG